MIHWNSNETHLLLNPRAPGVDRSQIEDRLRALKPLQAHVFVATSGSTSQVAGELKWVALSKEAILASAQAVNQHLGSDARDVWAHALPEFHVGGLGIHARAHLSGARVFRLEAWDAAEFRARCLAEAATLSALVPAQVHDLVRLGQHAPDSLRAIVVGGGALAPALYAAARELGYPVLPSYGSTECCSQVATALGDDPRLRLLRHIELRTDSDGRLLFRVASLLTGYPVLSDSGDRWFDPRREGWFVSEDFGSLSFGSLLNVRYLDIQGRSADFLKIGGESVDLSALERKLEELRLVERPAFDLALIALEDERLGLVVHGAATPRGETEERHAREIFARFNEAVLPFERARELYFLTDIPRSALGKLLRSELKAKLKP